MIRTIATTAILTAALTFLAMQTAFVAGEASAVVERVRPCRESLPAAIEEMRADHREMVAATGMGSDGRRFVLTIGQGGRWSALEERGGRGCLVAEGGGWRWSLMFRGRDL